MTRLRIGQSKITHEYLLTKTEPSFCNTCNQQITSQHLLHECRKYQNLRSKYPPETTKKRYQLSKGDPTTRPDIKRKFQHVAKDLIVDTTLNPNIKKFRPPIIDAVSTASITHHYY